MNFHTYVKIFSPLCIVLCRAGNAMVRVKNKSGTNKLRRTLIGWSLIFVIWISCRATDLTRADNVASQLITTLIKNYWKTFQQGRNTYLFRYTNVRTPYIWKNNLTLKMLKPSIPIWFVIRQCITVSWKM